MLKVVDKKQELAVTDVLVQRGLRAERLGDCFGDQRRIPQRRQADPENAGAEGWDKLGCGFDSKAGLARATSTGQRQGGSRPGEQGYDCLRLPFSSDEDRSGARQIGMGDRLERREALAPELED